MKRSILQKTVGTVVKTTDSVDPIAVLTVLPLRRYASLTCLKEIRAYLKARCTTNTQQFLQVWHLTQDMMIQLCPTHT